MIIDKLQQKIKVNAFKYGLLLGAILLITNIFSFYLITSIATSPLIVLIISPNVFSFIIPIIVALIFCFNIRKKVGGYWTFKQATTGIFIMFLIAYIIKLVGNDLIFDKYIEPNSTQKILTADVKAKVLILKQKGYDRKIIERAVSDLKKDFSSQKDTIIWRIIFGKAIVVLFLFLSALIFASLLRNAEYISVRQPQ